MKTYLIKIYEKFYLYDNFKINEHGIRRYQKPSSSKNRKKSQPSIRVKLKVRIISIDGISLHYLIQELKYAPTYRTSFVQIAFNSRICYHMIKFNLIPVEKEILDYVWNEKMTHLVRERCELDNTLSWLSTLGGAFSALGDYSVNCAEMAGKISYQQLKLAFKLQDDGIVSRCKLYFSLSLIQRRHYKLARSIIYNEYLNAKNALIVDNRLISMCKGIWSKLQYESNLNRQCKRLRRLKA